MNCKYYLNSKVFDSEASLDEYLLVTSALKPYLGDIVFLNWSKLQLNAYKKILDSEKSVEDAISRGEIKIESEINGEPEDIDDIKGNKIYKSITELIHELRTVDLNGNEHPLFPIFNSENYWSFLRDKYIAGMYSDPKIAAQLPFVIDLIPKNASGEPQAVKDTETLLKIEERMTDVWKQQALCGDLIHAMLSDFYRSKVNGKRFSSLNETELTKAFELKLNEEFYKKYKSYINDKVVATVVNEAIKIDREIRSKYGENCMILSEKRVVGRGVFGKNSVPIVGKLDLLVISETGKIGILDFKCSPKEYTEFNNTEDPSKYDPAKIRTYQYLLAAYRRLLLSIGINSQNSETELSIIPLQFLNFRFNSNTNKVEFDGVKSSDTAIQVLPNSTYSKGGELYHTIESNLELIFPSTLDLDDMTTGEVLDTINKEEKVLFKGILKDKYIKTDDEIANLIKEKGGIKKNKLTNNWEFSFSKKDKIKIKGNKSKAEAEVEVSNILKERTKKKAGYIPMVTQSLRKDFLEAYENGTLVEFSSYLKKYSYNNDDPLWLPKQLGKYNDSEKYELMSDPQLDPILDLFGVLLFKNKATLVIDVIKISLEYDPSQNANLGNRKSILGTFVADEVVKADSNSLVMDGAVGNIEIMEAMLLLNKLPSIFNKKGNKAIGEIKLISPGTLKGLTASNEQILYNFRRLCKYGKILNNFVDEENKSEGKILMLNYVSKCMNTFNEILSATTYDKGLGKLSKEIKSQIKSCISDLDDLGENPVVLRQKLIELDRDLVNFYGHLNSENQNILNESENPEYQLHRDLLFAISELSGVKLLQLIEDHAKFTLNGGISGTEIDNPGTLQSKTLNEFTDLVTKAYLNVRDNVIAFNLELRKKVEALKADKNFGLAKQYIAGNQVSSLYANMFDNSDGDLMFVNPWDNSVNLTTAEREFLKFAILKINDNRHKNFNPDNIETLIANNPNEYLRVPLVKGDLTSEVHVRGGWLEFIKYRFSLLSPSKLRQRLNKTATNLFNMQDESKLNAVKRGEMWEAINFFDAGERPDTRKQLLDDEDLGGEAYFEHNIETLLLKHTSAYKMSEELNNIFPILRALTLHLTAQGSILNEKFLNDLEYIFKYIKTRIHNQPVENRESGLESFAADVAKTMMKTTSKLALAFNPRLWYLFLDGIWKDCQLYFRFNFEEDNPFTREGLFKGWKLVMSDLKHFGNDFTMSELLNQLYGFNDMDSNTYIDRIKTDNTGLLYHFWNVGFRFASRPDFYNRMTIFYAQMHKDGSLEAHKMVNGKLKYNWKDDKRFDAFARGDKSDIEKYNKLKSLYITMAQQFMEEGARNEDGELFILDLNNPQALPKAYTNKLSESMKALSDRIYGYYAHEKKSLIHSNLVGSMLMQMNTYWSAKKNQYAQTRSFTQEGDWAQYEENGELYYWKEDEDGDLIPTTENTGVPVQIWKGRPQEGIALTGWELLKAAAGRSDQTSKSGLSGIFDLLKNEDIDPQVRRLYKSNLRQLLSDLILWLLIGSIMTGAIESQVKDYIKSNGNDTLGKSLKNTFLHTGSSILKASTMDANFFESIFGRGKDWTPFAIKSTDRLASNLVKVGTGKQDLYDFMIKSTGGGNATKPMWDYVKYETFGEKIGQRKKQT